MVVTLHRFFEHLFGGHHGGPRPVVPHPQPEPPAPRGIPDGYLDKVPPPEEGAVERTTAAAHPTDRLERLK